MSGKATDKRREESTPQKPVSIQVFSADRVLGIHRTLVEFFASSPEPIRDLGLRDASLLEQAVSHQFSGELGGSDPLEKPAALMQGLFDELPFHDGNAQTAFIALMLLLDENGYSPNRVSFDAFFEFCSALNEHRLEPATAGKPGRDRKRASDESELMLILRWLEQHTRPEPAKDHPLALAEVQRLLSAHGFEAAESGRTLAILRVDPSGKKRLFGLGGNRKKVDPTPVTTVPMPSSNGLFSLTAMRELRKACGLETEAFYDWRAKLDSCIRQYQTLLTRLGTL
jgi:prophage maintenance system killer protein